MDPVQEGLRSRIAASGQTESDIQADRLVLPSPRGRPRFFLLADASPHRSLCRRVPSGARRLRDVRSAYRTDVTFEAVEWLVPTAVADVG